jgi:signal transduction histidine kinase
MSPDVAPETAVAERLPPAELKTLFLFESLTDDQLTYLSETGSVEERTAGSVVYDEDADATCFFVLLEGTIVLRRRVEGANVEVVRTEQRGVYAGATAAYVQTSEPRPYPGSMQAITDARFWVIDAVAFAEAIRRWFPMAMHLLEGLFLGMRASNAIVGQRERLLSLGRLSAGLTHELNNPAAAAVSATAALRERTTKMRRKLAHLAGGKLDKETLLLLTAVQEDAVERLTKTPKLTPMETSDAEDRLGDWIDDRGLSGAWELAPPLVAAGVDCEWLDRLVDVVPAEQLENALRWVTYALETEMLMNEIDDATHRISALVGAAKQYTQLDRAAHQFIDVHDGLDSTLIMLGTKLKKRGVTVAKEYDRTLPDIPAYPAELNQVWTNMIDNAVGAMPNGGTLTLRTSLVGDHVQVEIADTGSGVPKELQERIFEPFFTTKPVGEGTGLGLDIAYRIVTQRHRGDLQLESEPGNTVFRVLLPRVEPPNDPM